MHRPHTTVANRALIYRSLKPQVSTKPGVLLNSVIFVVEKLNRVKKLAPNQEPVSKLEVSEKNPSFESLRWSAQAV